MLEFIPLHHVIFLNALLCSYELNTLDACWIGSMCGVIVVDAESFRSSCRRRDAYIHDHAVVGAVVVLFAPFPSVSFPLPLVCPCVRSFVLPSWPVLLSLLVLLIMKFLILNKGREKI